MIEPGASADEPLPSLLKLLTWLSPAFPVGAFGYSHGLEAAIAAGLVRDAESVADWIETLLVHGSGWNDLVLLNEAHGAQSVGDAHRLGEVAELAEALSGSAERRSETLDLGFAFAEASHPWTVGEGAANTRWPYPIAVGVLGARYVIPARFVLAAYAHAFAANLLAAAVRLVPLGQRQAVGVMRRLEPLLQDCATRAARSTLDDLGSAAILSEIQAMRHETLFTRLFRT